MNSEYLVSFRVSTIVDGFLILEVSSLLDYVGSFDIKVEFRTFLRQIFIFDDVFCLVLKVVVIM